jgi:signal transduction histidine kinase
MGAVVQFRAMDYEQKEDATDSILLAAVMESCVEGLAIVEGGVVLRANRAFAHTFGYFEGSDVAGKTLAGFIPESLFLFAVNPESAKETTHSAASECAGVKRDSAEIRVMAGSAVFRAVQRELQVINLQEVKAVRPKVQPADLPTPDQPEIDADKMELQKLESQRFFETQRLETMGRVVGSVAHDFNNLLTGILLYCDLLIRGLEPLSPLRAYVQEIRKAGGHSSGLIQQLLSVTQRQAKDSNAHSWNEVMSGMLNFLSRMLGENIELVTDLDSSAGSVAMTQTSMRQVALNLLLNARDAMPDGGRITLTARNCVDCMDSPSELLTGYVEFSVADNGCGMDAATCAHLFEPFFTTKAAGRGNGLGLATVERIVSEANGSLEVESEPNQGTRISVRLPQAPPNQILEQSQTQLRV